MPCFLSILSCIPDFELTRKKMGCFFSEQCRIPDGPQFKRIVKLVGPNLMISVRSTLNGNVRFLCQPFFEALHLLSYRQPVIFLKRNRNANGMQMFEREASPG
jgi:hypothetical protein